MYFLSIMLILYIHSCFVGTLAKWLPQPEKATTWPLKTWPKGHVKEEKHLRVPHKSNILSTSHVSIIFPPKDPLKILFSGMIGVTLKKQSESKTKTCEFPMICSFASIYTFFLWHFSVHKCQSYLSDMRVWTQKLQQTPTFYKDIQTYSDGRNSFETSNMFLRSCRLYNVKVFEIDASTTHWLS